MVTEAPVFTVTEEVGEVVGRTRAMATEIAVRTPVGTGPAVAELRAAVEAALAVFGDVQATCTRFDPESPLMQLNARSNGWRRTPPILFDALVEAHCAHQRTGGRFDPRVYTDLLGLGYDQSLPFGAGPLQLAPRAARRGGRRSPWRPRFRGASREVDLGGEPVELGGIGKGLSVRWAAQRLRRVTTDFLVEAGGDCYSAGLGPGRETWRIGIEDPDADGNEPIAVLALRDRSSTTSSIRVRHWTLGDRPAHHLIDPRTGEPGGHGLAAVTVVGRDAAVDEVWSKSLFLVGADAIAREAERRGLAAFWVTTGGTVAFSSGMQPHLLWQRP